MIEEKMDEYQAKISKEIEELTKQINEDEKIQLAKMVEKNQEELKEQLRVTVEKIKILQFLEKVCGGQRFIDYQKIKEIFKNSKDAMRLAEQKGAHNIQIISSG